MQSILKEKKAIIIFLVSVIVLALVFYFVYRQRDDVRLEDDLSEEETIERQTRELEELMKDFEPLTEEEIKEQTEKLEESLKEATKDSKPMTDEEIERQTKELEKLMQ
jgi:predicted Holliday junction resolvase-like endonuclease